MPEVVLSLTVSTYPIKIKVCGERVHAAERDKY